MDMIITIDEGKKVTAHYKDFDIITDQPIKMGGDNSAPAPFDLFLASIGTCAGVYVKSFCDQRNIPTDNIKLIQKMMYNSEKMMISKIIIEIYLPPDFPEKYKNAVIKTAELCAVKNHILDPPQFEIYTK